MRGDNFECLLDDDGLKHMITLVKSKDAVNDMEEHLDSKIQTWTILCRWVVIIESGRNTKTETVCTPGPKLQDEPVLDGRQGLILNKIDVTRLDFAETFWSAV